jgi:sporulation protein YunB
MAKRRKRIFLKIFCFFAVIIVIFLILSSYFLRAVSPVIKAISQEEVSAVTSNAVREAALNVVSTSGGETPEIINYDTEGNITSIRLNDVLVNRIVQQVGTEAQNRLARLGIRGVDVPIGSLSGFVFLAGKGPMVNIKIIPVGSVSVKINSVFSERGINQTNHKIYLSVNSNVNIVLPGANNSISTLTEVLICDTVIVGKIPSVYLNSSSKIDFVP